MGPHRLTFFPKSLSTPAALLTYQTAVEYARAVRVAFPLRSTYRLQDGVDVVVTDTNVTARSPISPADPV
jgi:hypothetical protein